MGDPLRVQQTLAALTHSVEEGPRVVVSEDQFHAFLDRLLGDLGRQVGGVSHAVDRKPTDPREPPLVRALPELAFVEQVEDVGLQGWGGH